MKEKNKEARLTKAELKGIVAVPNLQKGLEGGISYSNVPIKSLQQAAQQVKIERQEKEDDARNKSISTNHHQ